MTAKNNTVDHSMFLVLVGLLGWVVPGAGHLAIKETKRAAIIFVTVTGLFLTGLLVGSVGIIDSKVAWAWYLAQVMVSPVVFILDGIVRDGGYEVSGRAQDVGQIYTAVAGLLNMLCVLSAVYMAHSGRGEMIGEEEND